MEYPSVLQRIDVGRWQTSCMFYLNMDMSDPLALLFDLCFNIVNFHINRKQVIKIRLKHNDSSLMR